MRTASQEESRRKKDLTQRGRAATKRRRRSCSDKMWLFCENAISQEEQQRHARVYRETQGRDCGSTERFRSARISRNAPVDQLRRRDDELPLGPAGTIDGIWQACAAGERELETSV